MFPDPVRFTLTDIVRPAPDRVGLRGRRDVVRVRGGVRREQGRHGERGAEDEDRAVHGLRRIARTVRIVKARATPPMRTARTATATRTVSRVWSVASWALSAAIELCRSVELG